MGKGKVLVPYQRFREGHGIIGGKMNTHGFLIPMHAKNRCVYIWCPPPIIADITLEECMKSVHKQMDAYHLFLIPRLYTPCGFACSTSFVTLSFNSLRARAIGRTMHKPLFFGNSLPLLCRQPWTLRGIPLLVGLERSLHLHHVLSQGEGDGQDILHKLLLVPRDFASLPEGVACKMLRLSGDQKIPDDEHQG